MFKYLLCWNRVWSWHWAYTGWVGTTPKKSISNLQPSLFLSSLPFFWAFFICDTCVGRWRSDAVGVRGHPDACEQAWARNRHHTRKRHRQVRKIRVGKMRGKSPGVTLHGAAGSVNCRPGSVVFFPFLFFLLFPSPKDSYCTPC